MRADRGHVHVADLRLGWAICVDAEGHPILRRGRERAPLFAVSEQPRTCRLLIERLERWLEASEGRWSFDDPIVGAVRWSVAHLREYLEEATCAAVA